MNKLHKSMSEYFINSDFEQRPSLASCDKVRFYFTVPILRDNIDKLNAVSACRDYFINR